MWLYFWIIPLRFFRQSGRISIHNRVPGASTQTSQKLALEQIYPQIMTKIQFELSDKPSKAEKDAQGQSGFVPVTAR